MLTAVEADFVLAYAPQILNPTSDISNSVNLRDDAEVFWDEKTAFFVSKKPSPCEV